MMATEYRQLGRLLVWVGAGLLMVGGFVACQGGISQMGCGDRDTGYDECMDDSTSSRNTGGVVALAGMGTALAGVVQIGRK